jgi:hypothetical protein
MSAANTDGFDGLVVARILDVEQYLRAGSASSGIARFLRNVFAPATLRTIKGDAKYFANQAVWFDGARMRLGQMEAGDQLAMPDAHRVHLEKFERELLTQRARLLESMPGLDRLRDLATKSTLAEAHRLRLHALTDLYEAFSAFRWAALELDAQCERASCKAVTFDSVKALLADLSK